MSNYRGQNSAPGHLGFTTIHGLRKIPEYGVWNSMKMRCLNPKSHKYPIYGGRGIRVCERWMKFSNFISDMGRRPSKSHTLERKDTDGDYEPGNCIWATMSAQCRNKRNNRILTIDGISKCALEWSEISGVNYPVLLGRLNRGWDSKDAVFTPISR